MSKTIGQRIKELREQRGLTQAELAKLLSLTVKARFFVHDALEASKINGVFF